MAEVAVQLTDAVIPHLPVRQWVLSVPKRLRPFLHLTPEAASAVLAIFLRALRAAPREASPSAPAALRDAQLGAVSFPQRFGSSLNPHYHYHVLALDGVISSDIERGVQFHEATDLEAREAEAMTRTVQRRVLRWFARRGLLDPTTAADMRSWRGTGGFSVDGSVRIEAEDRGGLERLVRYCARGPLALERLHAPAGIGTLTSPEARLVYRLPEADVHGRQALRLTPLELLQRLARLVPPPDQRFASVPSTATATTGSSLPTRASGPWWSPSDGPCPTTSPKTWGLPRHPIHPTGSSLSPAPPARQNRAVHR